MLPDDACSIETDCEDPLKIIIPAVFILLILAGCTADTEATSAVATKAPAKAPAATTQAPVDNALAGKVLETFDSGGYTYLRIATAKGEEWAAVRETKVAVGQVVSVEAQLTMEKFESATLKRTFDRIVFGSLAGAQASQSMPPSMASSAMPPGHPPAGASSGSPMGTPADHMKASAPADIRVEKAEGGHTVAEIWANRKVLSDKPVVVRGQVVKSLNGIMGRNWIHIRDGSGSAAAGDNDLTVTSTATARVGDVVTVKGTLRVDKDFGAGYEYGAIVEDARIE
jgi:hypothetical protein